MAMKRRGRKQKRRRQSENPEPETLDHLRLMLRSDAPRDRRKAACALGELDRRARTAAPDLIDALADGDPGVRAAAARALARLVASKTHVAFARISDLAERAEDAADAEAFESQKERFESYVLEWKNVVAETVNAVLQESDEQIRQGTGLEYGTDPMADTVVRALSDALGDPDAGVRAAAARALAARLRGKFHCIRLDLSGHGQSSVPIDHALLFEALSGGRMAVCDAAGVRRPTSVATDVRQPTTACRHPHEMADPNVS